MSVALQDLSDALGILPAWHDLAGNLHVPSPDTQRALLAAMGIAAANDSEAEESLSRHREREESRLLPTELVVAAGDDVRLPLAAATDWRLELEDGGTLEGRADETIALAALPAGLHRLLAGDDVCLLIGAPARAPDPIEILGRAQGWGVTAALYGFRSSRDLGVGDYADLASAATAFGRLGADFIGINPLHARGAASDSYSPYTPSCRTAFEPSHIAVDRAPGFADSEAARRVLDNNANQVAAARAAELVDYDAGRHVTQAVLRALFAEDRPKAFEAWRRGPGGALEWFALFEALSMEHGPDWRVWPEPLRRIGNPETAAFAERQAESLRYHLWLQWLAEEQVSAAQTAARRAGMALGLYLDIAVGVRPGGADTWARPDCFARGVSLGAPPDAFAPNGQNWSLAPFSPAGLRNAGYRPFVEMLRSAMRHAGLVRIDHILGLQRAYWVPENGAPGGYVSYPLEPMLALVRLEAHRAGCVVVGEDLGSVPEGLRGRLAEAGLLGCSVMQFEKQDGRLRPPAEYRSATLASFGTHDTPTLRGWWAGWDLDRRHAINGGDEETLRNAKQDRASQRRSLARMLQDAGLSPDGLDPEALPGTADGTIVDGVHALLAQGPTPLIAVQLDDALGMVEQQNLPGTIDEYPNWRRRYPVAIEDFGAAPGLDALSSLPGTADPRPSNIIADTRSRY